ncbi:MAG: hypothetical protein ABL994_02350 [Verrucomicrobiales bacterium]
MRDSWIDKKELEELVGEFSSAEGKSRRRGHSPDQQEGSDKSDLGAVESLLDLRGKEGGGATPKTPDAPAGEVEKGSIVIEPVPLEGAGPVQDDVDAAGDLDSPSLAPIVRAQEKQVKTESSAFFDPEPFDPDAPEMEFDLFKFDDETEEPAGNLIAELGAEPSAITLIEGIPTEVSPVEGVVSNLTVEATSGEGQQSRKIPAFLGGSSEVPEARTARDADRAITALAEARARVDESRLLQSLPQETLLPAISEIEADAEEVLPISGTGEGRDITPGESLPLHTRLENFGDSVQRELGASEVAVCDADGFLLYKSSGFGVDKALHHSLLLQVSGRMNTFLGLGKEGVSQLNDGNGIWRCLISGDGQMGSLFAGFTLPKPLEQKELEIWKSALVETITPSLRKH